jgi:hypothetical protein
MSIQRLRQVLSSNFTVVADSSQTAVDKVQQLATARQQSLVAAGKIPPGAKAAQLVPALANTPSITFRAIDLLRKTGELTTPQWANMARLSASWATRRYHPFSLIANACGRGYVRFDNLVGQRQLFCI